MGRSGSHELKNIRWWRWEIAWRFGWKRRATEDVYLEIRRWFWIAKIVGKTMEEVINREPCSENRLEEAALVQEIDGRRRRREGAAYLETDRRLERRRSWIVATVVRKERREGRRDREEDRRREDVDEQRMMFSRGPNRGGGWSDEGGTGSQSSSEKKEGKEEDDQGKWGRNERSGGFLILAGQPAQLSPRGNKPTSDF
jgi:hypothetical protein